jgi:alternative ribosome-rescue factor
VSQGVVIVGASQCQVYPFDQEITVKKHSIRDNALQAQLRTPMFKMQQQTPKKGKGSYSRKGRNSLKSHKVLRGYRQVA